MADLILKLRCPRCGKDLLIIKEKKYMICEKCETYWHIEPIVVVEMEKKYCQACKTETWQKIDPTSEMWSSCMICGRANL